METFQTYTNALEIVWTSSERAKITQLVLS